MAPVDIDFDGFESLKETLDEIEADVERNVAFIVGTRVEYAVYLELGTSRMDPKPFIRPAVFEAQKSDLRTYISKYGTEPFDSLDTVEQVTEELAVSVKNNIRLVISEKGLIDTGTLIKSISVVPRGQEDKLPTESDVDV